MVRRRRAGAGHVGVLACLTLRLHHSGAVAQYRVSYEIIRVSSLRAEMLPSTVGRLSKVDSTMQRDGEGGLSLNRELDRSARWYTHVLTLSRCDPRFWHSDFPRQLNDVRPFSAATNSHTTPGWFSIGQRRPGRAPVARWCGEVPRDSNGLFINVAQSGFTLFLRLQRIQHDMGDRSTRCDNKKRTMDGCRRSASMIENGSGSDDRHGERGGEHLPRNPGGRTQLHFAEVHA